MKNFITILSLALITASFLSSCNKEKLAETSVYSETVELTENTTERSTCENLSQMDSENINIQTAALAAPEEYTANALASLSDERILLLKFELPENFKVSTTVIGFRSSEKSYIVRNNRVAKGNIFQENICFEDVMDPSSNTLEYYITDNLGNRSQLFSIEL